MAIDLRSDTVTQPTAGMREAMMSAPLGDDVFGEDPSVNQLEAYSAELLGKEAALFVPSGTMANQIALKVHTKALDEIICAKDAHIYLYEPAGFGFLSGCSIKLLEGDRGRLTAKSVAAGINQTFDWKANTSLVCLENTVNQGGGAVYDLEEVQKIQSLCAERGLALHLDGARLMNAVVASGHNAATWAAPFDSVSVCLSKGLGAPVGSVLVGSRDFIAQARRVRKILGGGMRQAGLLAAAGLYALQHQTERLKEDHVRATRIGEALAAAPWCEELLAVESNIVIGRIKDAETNNNLLLQLERHGIRAIAMGPDLIRFVTHLQISDEDTAEVIKVIGTL